MAHNNPLHREADPRTIFHLTYQNAAARQVLERPENRTFVSAANDNRLGLEIGYHVPSTPGGQVITRLGRDADLILPGTDVARFHIAFQVHPDTLAVLLSVRAKEPSQVTVEHTARNFEWQLKDGDCVLVYGEEYWIKVVGYLFKLKWRTMKPGAALKDMVAREYRNALQLAANLGSRDRPTEYESDIYSWHNTRLHSVARPGIQEAPNATRSLKGKGSFGEVLKTLDVSGGAFAVKVVRLSDFPNSDHARQMLHREIKAISRIKHVRQ